MKVRKSTCEIRKRGNKRTEKYDKIAKNNEIPQILGIQGKVIFYELFGNCPLSGQLSLGS